MKKKILLLFVLGCASAASAQNFAWGGKYGGLGEDVVNATHTDSEGNTYSTGYFTETADFDPMETVSEIINPGSFQIFVSKIDNQGNLVWAKQFGGAADDYGTAITSDAAGNVYVTGVYQETADFDPNDGEVLLTSSGYLDIFVLKLDPNGNLTWAQSFGGVDYEQTTGIETDAGNVYLSGYFYAEADFAPGDTQFNMTPAGSGDGFAVKLDASGDFIWAKQFGGTGFDLCSAMTFANDQLYFTGNFSWTADFNPDLTEVFHLTASIEEGTYVMRLDTDGDFVSAVKISDVSFHGYALGIDVDSQNNAIVTGYFGGTSTFQLADETEISLDSPDYFNSYVAKIDDNGELLWAKPIFADQGSTAYKVKVNSHDEVFVLGFYTGNLDVEGQVVVQAENGNAQENFLTRFDADGHALANYGFGGSNFVDGSSFGIDANDNLYVSAGFEGTVDINPMPTAQQTFSADGFRDAYIFRFEPTLLSTPDISIESFTVYPNPANGIISIHSPASLEDMRYEIIDAAGRISMSGLLSEMQQLDIAPLQSGVYFLKIGQECHRIVKI